MTDLDDIDGDEGGLPLADAVVSAALVGAATACLACGGAISGPYCSTCGQKNDDLRRSSFVLAKDFMKDTFGFDSRMWRTLGLLATSPGLVPKDYAHGRRSRFTPPVRLFLVISFLFFLTIGLTNTLFVGLDVVFKSSEAKTPPAETTAAGEVGKPECSFQAKLKFFAKERDLNTDRKRLDLCMSHLSGRVHDEVPNLRGRSRRLQ